MRPPKSTESIKKPSPAHLPGGGTAGFGGANQKTKFKKDSGRLPLSFLLFSVIFFALCVYMGERPIKPKEVTPWTMPQSSPFASSPAGLTAEGEIAMMTFLRGKRADISKKPAVFCGNQPPEETVTPSESSLPEVSEVPTAEEKETDDRGIDGMSAQILMTVYTSEPFNIPVPEARESAPENTAFSRYYSGISTGTYSSIYGCERTYDYVLSVDDDDEIVSATFGVASYDDKGSGTLNAADLYFYAVALNPYDTTDKEYLANWLEESLPKASEGKQTVTAGRRVGGAQMIR